MKKIVIICGLIAGLIVSALLVFSTAMCYTEEDFEGNMALGFTVMFLAFSVIFVGIKNYRDKHNEGAITFGKAFLTGLYITLVASTLYVVVWLIDYYLFIPDFMDKYAAHEMHHAVNAGKSAEELKKLSEQMDSYKEAYKNPVSIVLLTYMEILPVGLVVTLVSALILRRRKEVVNG